MLDQESILLLRFVEFVRVCGQFLVRLFNDSLDLTIVEPGPPASSETDNLAFVASEQMFAEVGEMLPCMIEVQDLESLWEVIGVNYIDLGDNYIDRQSWLVIIIPSLFLRLAGYLFAPARQARSKKGLARGPLTNDLGRA